MAKDKDTIRVSLDLSEPFHRRLSELETLTNAESKAGVIRQALQVYEYFATKTLEGCRFTITNKEGRQESLVFFGPAVEVSREREEDRVTA